MIPIYAQRIREVRQAAGMNQAEFAAVIGTTKNQLSKYELGTQDTPTKIIIAVCNGFAINANWLLGIQEQEYKRVLEIEVPFDKAPDEETIIKVNKWLNTLKEKKDNL